MSRFSRVRAGGSPLRKPKKKWGSDISARRFFFPLAFDELLTFDLSFTSSGADLAPTRLFYDGYLMELAWLYKGEDASLSGFPEGTGSAEALTVDPSATAQFGRDAPLDGQSFKMGTTLSDEFSGTVNNSVHQIDSDFVYFFLLRAHPESAGREMICNNGGTNNSIAEGWQIRDVSGVAAWFIVADGTNRCRVSISPSGWTDGAWQLFVFAGDLDETTVANSMRGANNLNPVIGASDTALGSLTSTINTASGLTFEDTGFECAFAGMYKGPDVFPGGSSNAVIMESMIRQLQHRLMGIYPVGVGTLSPSYTRNTVAYVPVVNADGYQRFNYVGSEWPRVGSVLSDDGYSITKGYLSEESRTQQMPGTESMASVWATLNATAVDGYEDTISPPVVGSTVTLLHIENGSGQHKIQESLNSSGDATLSFFVKLHPDSPFDTVVIYTGFSRGRTFYNLVTGSITLNTHDQAGMRSVGDGWYYCWCYHPGLVAFPILINQISFNYTGGTQPCFYLCAPQGEHTSGSAPSSYIRNTASSGTETRAADLLEYDGNNVPESTTRTVDANVWKIDHTVPDAHAITSLFSSTNNRILLSVDSTSEPYAVTSGNGEETLSSSTVDQSDGYEHSIRYILDGYSVELYSDGILRDSDTRTALGPSSFNEITVGNYNSGNHVDGIVSNIKVWSTNRGPPE